MNNYYNKNSMKINLFYKNKELKICLYEDLEDNIYRCWNIPFRVLDEVIEWTKTLSTKYVFPLCIKKTKCIIEMNSDKSIYIKEVAPSGYIKTVGWDMPIGVFQEVINKYENKRN